MTYDIPQGAVITAISDQGFSLGEYDEYSGLVIETQLGVLKIGIEAHQDCCEQWDALFLETPDDISKFIGAGILEVSDTNDRNVQDDGGETQLKIVTTRGVLQYAVYNDHNGYYSHATFIQVFEHTERGYL